MRKTDEKNREFPQTIFSRIMGDKRRKQINILKKEYLGLRKKITSNQYPIHGKELAKDVGAEFQDRSQKPKMNPFFRSL